MDIITVRRGDTLYAIARRYGTTVETLSELNQLTDPALLLVGQALVVPTGRSPGRRETILVNGYLSDTSDAALRETLPYLSFLSPFCYRVAADGSLTKLFSVTTELSASEATANLLTVTNLSENGGFSSDIAHAILTQEAPQERFLSELGRLLEDGDYAGVNLDLEYVYPFDRGSYNQFLGRLSAYLHEKGRLLVTALAPKLSDTQQGLLYAAHDYAVHGAEADYCVLMTYEWGYTYGPPMAVSPVDKVRQVLDYAVGKMPAGKLLMGVPNYGYDWTLPYQPNRAARALSNTGALRLAGQVRAAIEYDEKAQAPFFRYTDKAGQRHEVWFEDARSLRAKYRLISEYGLGGVSFWNLNSLFRTNFLVLENMFGIEKIY